MANKVDALSLTQNDGDFVNDINDAIMFHKNYIMQSPKYNANKYFIYNYKEKLNVTVAGNNSLRVSTGQMLIHGYNLGVDVAATVPVDSGASAGTKGYIIGQIDRSLTTNQASLQAINGSTSTLPSLTQEDILNTDGLFQAPIATYEIDTVGNITNIVILDNLDTEYLNGQIHPDVMVEIESFMTDGSAQSIDVPYRDYISGITLYTTDYDDAADQFNNADTGVFYLPRRKPVTPPIGNSSGGNGDTLFGYQHTLPGSNLSSAYPQPADGFSTIYVGIDYGSTGDPYPNGISIKGRMDTKNPDRVLAFAIIHYGATSYSTNTLEWVAHQSYTPATLFQPIEER